MKFVAIEFRNGVNNTNMLGYLKIPDSFDPMWSVGFRCYLMDKYMIPNGVIRIYPLKFRNTPEAMGRDIAGYTNLEDDFNLALRSTYYYPNDPDSDRIRRQYSVLDPMCPDYRVKERNR